MNLISLPKYCVNGQLFNDGESEGEVTLRRPRNYSGRRGREREVGDNDR